MRASLLKISRVLIHSLDARGIYVQGLLNAGKTLHGTKFPFIIHGCHDRCIQQLAVIASFSLDGENHKK
jgi:hypothetical protein